MLMFDRFASSTPPLVLGTGAYVATVLCAYPIGTNNP